MGTGVGIKCKYCSEQLNYDDDTKEIVEGKDICHKCMTLKKIIEDRGQRV